MTIEQIKRLYDASRFIHLSFTWPTVGRFRFITATSSWRYQAGVP